MTRLRRRLDLNAEDPILALILLALGFLAGCVVGLILGYALAAQVLIGDYLSITNERLEFHRVLSDGEIATLGMRLSQVKQL
ncbi:MAG: hypothetical protein WCB11_28890 [Terriglobales bacterium]